MTRATVGMAGPVLLGLALLVCTPAWAEDPPPEPAAQDATGVEKKKDEPAGQWELGPGQEVPQEPVLDENGAVVSPSSQKPSEDKGEVGEEKPGGDEPGGEKLGDSKPGEEKPDEEKPDEEKPGEEKPGEEKSGGGMPAEGKPGEEKPVGEEPVEGTPGGEGVPGASAAAGQEAVGKTAEEGESEGPEFIKGELIYPGTRRLLSRFDHIGVGLGASIIEDDVFAVVAPGFAWYFDFGLAMSAHVPLQLQAVEVRGEDISYGGLKIRHEDWDEIADYAKIVRFITYGRKEDHIYVSINTMRPATIGHGMLMSRYQGDIDVDRSLTGLLFDAYNDYAGFQFQANDVTVQNRVIAALAFVKPLSLFLDDPISRSFSLGAEYVTDMRAPRCIKLRRGADQPCVQGTGHAAGADPYTGETLDGSFVRTHPDHGRYAVEETMVHAVGASVEIKVLKTDRDDLKLYGTYHQYLNEGGGQGASGGLLARLNAGQEWISAFRLRAAYHSYGDGFRPAYFNTFYEIQKYEFLAAARNFQVAPTKYQQVFGDPDNGFARPKNGWRHGFQVDLHWALFKGKRSAKQLGLGVGLMDSTGPHDSTFYAHLEFPMLEWLQVFGTYLNFDAPNLKDLFSEPGQAVVLAGLRLRILPALFINAHYARSFRVKASPGTEIHMGNDRVVDANGLPSPWFGQDTLFSNVHAFYAELELGWEFSDD